MHRYLVTFFVHSRECSLTVYAHDAREAMLITLKEYENAENLTAIQTGY